MSEEEGGLGQLSRFGLASNIAKGLASIIGTIGLSIGDTGACQYSKASEVLNNIYQNDKLYKYLPAIIFPNRVIGGYINTYNVFQNPTQFDISKASEIQSIMIRHGLLVSTQKGDETVYLYIGAIPEGFNYTNKLTVAQGGAKFHVKSYKTLFENTNINPKFGILPLVKEGVYYTNPPISQGGNGFVADIVGIFNYMTSTLFQILLHTVDSLVFNKEGGQYNINYDLLNALVNATSAKLFADTPAIHIQFINSLIAPSIPDSVSFNPKISLFGTLSGEKLNKAIEGSPIYISVTDVPELCSDLQLRGFVNNLDIITEQTVISVPFFNKQIRVSPGLSYGEVVQPPNSWNYDDLINWAINNGMGLSWDTFDKWIDLTLFESKVITELTNRGFGYLAGIVHDYFDPAPEVIQKGVDYVVNGIVNAVSSGVNSVVNFLKSL
jgi:hypothetical protein